MGIQGTRGIYRHQLWNLDTYQANSFSFGVQPLREAWSAVVFGVAILIGLKAEAEATKSDKAMVSFMVMG